MGEEDTRVSEGLTLILGKGVPPETASRLLDASLGLGNIRSSSEATDRSAALIENLTYWIEAQIISWESLAIKRDAPEVPPVDLGVSAELGGLVDGLY